MKLYYQFSLFHPFFIFHPKIMYFPTEHFYLKQSVFIKWKICWMPESPYLNSFRILRHLKSNHLLPYTTTFIPNDSFPSLLNLKILYNKWTNINFTLFQLLLIYIIYRLKCNQIFLVEYLLFETFNSKFPCKVKIHTYYLTFILKGLGSVLCASVGQYLNFWLE